MKLLKRIIAALLILAALAAAGMIIIYRQAEKIGAQHTVAAADAGEADCIIVPGAGVSGDRVSLALARRLDKALEIYNLGKIDRIIVSGDHGRKNYDEVNVMREYLAERGVPIENIFMDHAGFSTYDTIYRARDVFLVKRAVIVTQRLHLRRALYIADALGVECVGVEADNSTAASTRIQMVREYPARIKAFLQCYILHSKPKYLGEAIPVSGSGLATEG